MTAKDAEALLRARGLRATRQRAALIAALGKSRAPQDARALVKAGRGEYDTATAYRMLAVLRDAGIVRRIDLAQGRSLFELPGQHHHHAVCISCGAIRDVAACIPASLHKQVSKATGFAEIVDHSLEFFGRCQACKKQP